MAGEQFLFLLLELNCLLASAIAGTERAVSLAQGDEGIVPPHIRLCSLQTDPSSSGALLCLLTGQLSSCVKMEMKSWAVGFEIQSNGFHCLLEINLLLI